MTEYTRMKTVAIHTNLDDSKQVVFFEQHVTETPSGITVNGEGNMSFELDPSYEIPLLDANGAPTGGAMRLSRVYEALKDLYAAQSAARDAAQATQLESP